MKETIRKILARGGVLFFKVPRNIGRSVNPVGSFIDKLFYERISFPSIDSSREAYEVVKSNTMVPFPNLAALYEQVRQIEHINIPGDIVECGVWKGGATGVMALANLKYGSKRRDVHLFDAFDDICAPDPEKDGNRAVEESKNFISAGNNDQKSIKPMKGFYDSMGGHGTIDACSDLLFNRIGYDREKVHFYQGWFQDTFPVHADKISHIAVLRLDSDWYDSTRLCLEHFYDKVVTGGLIIIDDYGAYDGCRKAVDEFFTTRGIKKMLMNSFSLNGESYFMIK